MFDVRLQLHSVLKSGDANKSSQHHRRQPSVHPFRPFAMALAAAQTVANLMYMRSGQNLDHPPFRSPTSRLMQPQRGRIINSTLAEQAAGTLPY